MQVSRKRETCRRTGSLYQGVISMNAKKELGTILTEGLRYQYGITQPAFVAEINTLYSSHRTSAAIIRERRGNLFVVVSNPLKFGSFALYRLEPDADHVCRAVLLKMAKDTIRKEQYKVHPKLHELSGSN